MRPKAFEFPLVYHKKAEVNILPILCVRSADVFEQSTYQHPSEPNPFMSRSWCLAKLSENVNPEIDRHRHHRHYDNQDDK